MKKTIFLTFLLSLVSLFAFSNGLPSDNISLGRAFAHCFSTTSYVVSLIVIVGVSLVGLGLLIKNYKKNQEWSIGHNLIVFVIIAAILSAILFRPAEISANTTNEQADRGVFIGY
jgi:hypothetical protein